MKEEMREKNLRVRKASPRKKKLCVGWINFDLDYEARNGSIYATQEIASFFAGFADVVQVRAFVEVPAAKPSKKIRGKK